MNFGCFDMFSDNPNINLSQNSQNKQNNPKQQCESELSSDRPNITLDYTHTGVLQYIESEFTNYRMQTLKWDVERAELKAQIAYLMGLHKQDDNLKQDLIMRVKMLEHSLRQIKNESPGVFLPTDNLQNKENNSSVDEESKCQTSKWQSGREMLRKYLDELGLKSTLLDLRDSHLRLQLGLEHCNSVGGELAQMKPTDEESQDIIATESIFSINGTDKEQELLPKSDEIFSLPAVKVGTEDSTVLNDSTNICKSPSEFPLNIFDIISNDIQNKEANNDSNNPQFKFDRTLSGHLGPVRAIAFHPSVPLLLSASDDHLVNLWNVDVSIKHDGDALFLPMLTYYGSLSPVLCVTFTEDGCGAVAGTLSGNVMLWPIPQFSCTNFLPFDKHLMLGRELCKHSEAVWNICSSNEYIISTCVAGMVNIISLSDPSKSNKYNLTEGQSVVSTTLFKDGGTLLFGYSSGLVEVRSILNFEILFELNFEPGIYKILSHPFLPYQAAACVDGTIRFFSTKNGSQPLSLDCHNSSIMSADWGGGACYIVTAASDGIIKVWNMLSQNCIADFNSPVESVFGENVYYVAFHQHHKIFAASCVDGSIQIYS